MSGAKKLALEKFEPGLPNGSAADALAAFSAGWDAAMQHALALAARSTSCGDDCDNLGFMDPETGVTECAAETRGDICTCAERNDEGEKVCARIRTALASGATP